MRGHIPAILFLACLHACAGSEVCPQGYFDCGGICADLLNDTTNCGQCAFTCSNGQVCTSGVCVLSCQEGYTDCSGVCRDLMTDQNNCGMCGVTCAAGYVCIDGACAPDCPEGYSNCLGTCKNLENDPSNCGECGTACEPGEVCFGGTCTFTCPEPYIDCSGSCADLMTDHGNCGACGDACLGAQICVDGACQISCPSGFTNCSGACVDVQRDHENCGSCATACASDEVCSDGTCMPNCPGGFTDCSGSCRDLDSDRLNCGACDTVCPDGDVCESGACGPICPSPFVNCSGVCADLDYDPRNCSSCGTACASDEACVLGTCRELDCPGCAHSTLTGTPDPTTVFNTIDQTYFFDNNLMNCIWHRPSNRILSGFYSRDMYWSFPAGAGGYPQYPDRGTGSYDRMVHMPASTMVIHTDQAQYASDYNRIFIGQIDLTGMLGTFSVVTFSDGFTGACNLISASANEFLCYDGSGVRRYGTAMGSTTLTFISRVTLSPNLTETCPTYCFGGTFAWDGMYYYFSYDGNSSTNTRYVVYDDTGASVGTYTATGTASITATYFDWSVGRYATHDGFGYRDGGSLYTWVSGTYDDDTQCYGPLSPYHSH